MKQQRTEPIESTKKLQNIELGETTKIKLFVWKLRTKMRDIIGKDALAAEKRGTTATNLHRVYRKVEEFTGTYFPALKGSTPKNVAIKRLEDVIGELGYSVVEKDIDKPWGAYFRMANSDAERFVSEFFPGLTYKEALLGNKNAELSPKFLIVAPGQRLSWQFHYRRAERWRFLNDGTYHRSATDKQGKVLQAKAGEVIQFAPSERHRLCAHQDGKSYTLVAEMWQHVDKNNLSDEDDIVRLSDDYKR